MLDTTKVLPPTVAPPTRPLSILQSIRAARRNVLEIIPELAYRQPMLSGRMGSRWHMVQNPGALRRVLLDNVENYPKSEVMLRMLRPAVGPWFTCSVYKYGKYCGRDVAKLYQRGKLFACRHCHGLAYASQQESSNQRGLYRAQRFVRAWAGASACSKIFRTNPRECSGGLMIGCADATIWPRHDPWLD